jgi:serine/threonine protein kinase
MYAIMKPVVLVIDESKLPEGSIPEDIVIESLIERQLSYCSDWNSVRGLIDYYGSDDPRSRYFTLVASNVIKGSPVSIRPELEPDFKDLIVRMMKVDPRQRLTAKEALAHRWFKVIPE